MRKLLIVALVAVAALVVCAPAMAWPVSLTSWQPTDHFTCVGKIQTVEPRPGPERESPPGVAAVPDSS